MKGICQITAICAVSAGIVLGQQSAVFPNDNAGHSAAQAEDRLVKADNRFGFKLFRAIVQREEGKNIFVSPLSVALALGMTYNGAAGGTRQAMRETLEMGDLTVSEVNQAHHNLTQRLLEADPQVQFEIANSIWYREGLAFEKEFLKTNQTFYGAQIRSLDFGDPAAPAVINQWVNQETQGRIQEIVGDIDPLTVMFLINALYFKGKWTQAFEPERTQDDWFLLSDGSRKSCRMMAQNGTFRYLEVDEAQIIDLPYGEGAFTMTVVLPRSEHNLNTLISELTPERWHQWQQGLSSQEGSLELPRFTLEYERELSDVLSSLGMEVAFTPQADFSNMYRGPEPLYISKVKHKTFLEVNEEGTEAAAVTSVEMKLTAVRPSFSMRVDHPFLILIQEAGTGTILFMGRITDPAP